MKVIIACVGSDGDLIPMLGLGKALKQQGISVSLLCGEWQQNTAKTFELDSYSILSTAQFSTFTAKAASGENEWLAFFTEAVLPSALPTYQYIAEAYSQNEPLLLIGSCHVFGLKLAQEKLGIPWIATHLQPENEVDPTSDAQRYFDNLASSKMNRIRQSIQLPALTHRFSDWMMHCETAILFYPEWFHQYRDANTQTNLYSYVGFPFVDGKSDADALPSKLDLLLAQDTPPLIFTYGTGNTHARTFFECAVNACDRLGLPAIFLSKQREMLPEQLPANTLWVDFVPLGELMPYTQLIVHHGGIGTCAQAFKAGIAQIIMPVGFDQFQNANKVETLKLGKQLTLADINGEALAEHIEQIVNSPEVDQQCRQIAQSFNRKSAFELAVEFIKSRFYL